MALGFISKPAVILHKPRMEEKKVMAQPELADFLKTLKSALTSANTTILSNTYSKLTEYVTDKNSGFVDQLLKGVFKCMCYSLGQYNSHRSRQASYEFVRAASNHYAETCGKHFVDGSKEFVEKHVPGSYGSDVLDWLLWASLVLKPTAQHDKDTVPSLLKSMAAVNYVVKRCDRPTVRQAEQRLWIRIVKEGDLLNSAIDLLSKGDALTNLPTLSSLLEAAHAVGVSGMEKTKSKLLELLTTTMFASKTRPSPDYMNSCSAIISSCTHDDFAAVVLPTAKRFMLRSPEIALFITVPYLQYVKLDLSKYSEEMSKLLTGEAKNKDEVRRAEAVRGFTHLAQHCSDPDAIIKALKSVFDVLVKGQGGKVTVIAERMDLTTAAGCLARNGVSGTLAKQSAATEALNSFTALLKQENNESQLVHAIEQLTKWLVSCPTNVPKEMLDKIQVGISPKTQSHAVRQAYLRMLITCFTVADAMQNLQALESQLLTTVTSSHSQPNQLPLANEAVHSSVLLLRLAKAELLSTESSATLFKILLSMDKHQLFIGDRFLTSATTPVLMSLSSLSELLLLQWPDKLDDANTRCYLSVVVYCACHSEYSARKAARNSISKLISGLGGFQLAKIMMQSLEALLFTQNWDEILNDSIENKAAPALTAKGFCEALNAITSLSNGDSKEKTELALLALLSSSHRAIALYHKNFWLRLVTKYKLSADQLVSQHATSLVEILTKEPVDQTKCKAIQTVMSVNGPSIVPSLVGKCRTLLSDPDLKEVTSEEYNIFQWPEGELFDTSVIEKTKENDDMRNLRRENKLYSYKDQLMEMEIRKELEAKRKAEGKHVEKLSKKQLEAKQAQLKLESDVRSRISSIEDGTWHHICVSWSSRGTARIHVDGVRRKASYTVSPRAVLLSGKLYIGQYQSHWAPSNWTEAFVGKLSELYIWNTDMVNPHEVMCSIGSIDDQGTAVFRWQVNGKLNALIENEEPGAVVYFHGMNVSMTVCLQWVPLTSTRAAASSMLSTTTAETDVIRTGLVTSLNQQLEPVHTTPTYNYSNTSHSTITTIAAPPEDTTSLPEGSTNDAIAISSKGFTTIVTDPPINVTAKMTESMNQTSEAIQMLNAEASTLNAPVCYCPCLSKENLTTTPKTQDVKKQYGFSDVDQSSFYTDELVSWKGRKPLDTETGAAKIRISKATPKPPDNNHTKEIDLPKRPKYIPKEATGSQWIGGFTASFMGIIFIGLMVADFVHIIKYLPILKRNWGACSKCRACKKNSAREIRKRWRLRQLKKASVMVHGESGNLALLHDSHPSRMSVAASERSCTEALDVKVKQAAGVLLAISSSGVSTISHYLPRICELIVPLLSYPVTSSHLSVAYIATIRSALGKGSLGELTGVLTLRIYEAAAELPKQWMDESVTQQRDRVLNILADASPLNAAAFSCCFPLLEVLLYKSTLAETQQLDILKVFQAHVQLRSDSETDGPSIMPRCAMMKVLLKLIDTGSSAVSQLAGEVLVILCQAASGDDGCALAEQDEVEALMEALISANSKQRRLALMGMIEMVDALPTMDSEPELGIVLMQRLWVAKYDIDAAVVKLAEGLWEDLGLELETTIALSLLNDVVSDIECIRKAAAASIVEILNQDDSLISSTVQKILSLYEEKLYRAPPVIDDFGRLLAEEQPDQWQARAGLALLLKLLAPLISFEDVNTLTLFYVPDALHDRDARVAVMIREAAIEMVEYQGKANVESLLPVLDKTLTELPITGSYDVVKQGIVVMMGNLAKHLDKDDHRVKPIVGKLITSLSVPSQPVQEAVANCLPPLVPSIKDSVPEIITKLVQLLLSSDNYGERKGAAYGLAGIVKGSGILTLKQLDIMNTLTTAVQNKKSAIEREGALFAFEMLSLMLGRLFEPYIVHVLPFLLLCLGDGSPHVREAANDTAKAVMSKLSAHGVKLVLPILLTALEDDKWRTKCGSVELLGAMAFCAPKQLSACLPQIVPQLVDVLADSHEKVRNSGATALHHIGEVIKNPEIQSIVPTLLNALKNPSHATTPCLQTLLDTQFVHFIDAPSLALIMPVVTRAIEDRSTETRKMACQIIGNMYSLTDQKDLAPYLPNIMPGLKKSLVDPVPEVRAMSARALGAMVRGIGDQGFDELQPWLMQTLTSDGNTVNRSGAAQGLSEVIGVLGVEKLKSTVNDILQTANRNDIPPYVRDGYIMMLIYLPMTFGDEFRQYVGPILPTVLKALADECEYVRETGLKAGQMIIDMFAETSIELLLPELEAGLFDENWRIRLSSVQLLGDLLYKLSGVSGKMSTETSHEDDNFGTELGQQTVIDLLGLERRNRVLSGLYMGRSDTALMVRQASLHVWKVIVSNTPKTLRDILPTLFSLLLGCLASNSYDKREVAARTLGDVVRKLGERVLPEILPILGVGLNAPEPEKRQGVCIGLSEIMKSTSKEQVLGFADSLIPTVCRALSDPVAAVRKAAAKTFDSLHSNVGHRALEDILPDLLQRLEDEDSREHALDGLQQVMAVKSHYVLPYLIPHLTAEPVNTKALSILASVAGPALDRDLHRILEALCKSLASKLRTPDEDEELGFCSAVVLSLETDSSARTTVDVLLRFVCDKDVKIQAASAMILNSFCKDTKLDYEDYLTQLFRNLIGKFVVEDEMVLTSCWDCVNSIVKRLDSTRCMLQVATVRQAVKYALSDLKGNGNLPGFCLLKKGITCLLPVYREGLLNGTPELKELSALSLSEAIKVASSDALKPSVVHITGPLIRVLGDRYGPTVRVAMLETITVLLEKCGPMLKPFIPQLQTTFLKALNDPSRAVRMKASDAMAQLMIIHMRADPVFTEINNNIKSSDDSSVRETYLHGLRLSLRAGGMKAGAAIRQEMTKTLLGLMTQPEDAVRTVASACIGVILSFLPEEEKADIIISQLLNTDNSNDTMRQARSAALFVALKESPEALLDGDKHREDVINTLISHASSDKIPVSQYGLRGMAMLLKNDLQTSTAIDKRLVIAIGKSMKSDSNDIKQLVGQAVDFVCRVANQNESNLEEACMKIWIPVLVNGSREKNSAVKAASDYALITMLKLRKTEELYKTLVSGLEPGKSDALVDTYSKSLKKLLKQNEPREEEFDATLIN